ncbi:glycosyl hydrolase family 71-domain-containing protein [Phyllosticta capitalensis]|uniref:Glycosyl hydrolase family 71-domain-containing protein n=2 Tax=Phyllosticta capitalensis TaxID=121624 RepID=A0ABR1Z0V6_9PEZI
MNVAAISAVLVGTAAAAGQVLADFKLINAHSYTQDTWKADMQAAKDVGIDGFALVAVPPNCQSADLNWQLDRIEDAFAVAAQQEFLLAPAFDMSYGSHSTNCPTGNAWNVTFMAKMIENAYSKSAGLRWDDKTLVLTHDGDGYGDAYFGQLKGLLSNSPAVIAPSFSTLENEVAANKSSSEQQAADVISQFSNIDGYFNGNLDSGYSIPHDTRADDVSYVDAAFQQALKKAGRSGPFVMGVAPWQFQDLASDTAAVQYADYAWFSRWNNAYNMQPDLVNILTWNDYVSSNYIRDLPQEKSSSPGSVDLGDQGNYVYGMNHTAWRTVASYYIDAYKYQSMPWIVHNNLVYWYRTHTKNATCSGGMGPGGAGPKNWDLVEDALFVWVSVRVSMDVEMFWGTDPNNNSPRKGTPMLTFTTNNTTPSMYKLPFPSDFPASADEKIYPQVVFNPSHIAYSKYDSVPVTAECAWENFNAVVQDLGPSFDNVVKAHH